MPNNWSRLSLRGIALRISRAWSLSGIRWARLFLVRLGDACTIVTDTITGRPARYIRDKLTEDLIASGLKPVAFPAQLSLTAPLGATGDERAHRLVCRSVGRTGERYHRSRIRAFTRRGDNPVPSRYDA